MFSILRFILIVGTIFYYSPVRQKGEGTGALDAFLPLQRSEPATVPADSPEASAKLETMWQALPNGAKQAVIDKILTTSGLSPAPSKPMEIKPTDTLQPEDRQLGWPGGPAKPRN